MRSKYATLTVFKIIRIYPSSVIVTSNITATKCCIKLKKKLIKKRKIHTKTRFFFKHKLKSERQMHSFITKGQLWLVCK